MCLHARFHISNAVECTALNIVSPRWMNYQKCTKKRMHLVWIHMLGMLCMSHMDQFKFLEWPVTCLTTWQRSTKHALSKMHLNKHSEAFYAITDSGPELLHSCNLQAISTSIAAKTGCSTSSMQSSAGNVK